MGNGMEKRIYIPLTVLGLLLLFIGVPILSAGTHFLPPHSGSLPVQHVDMLIFLSPQYANDTDIKISITRYSTAVYNDLGWNTNLVVLNPNQNTYTTIDEIIEHYYFINPIKACIMVGEDINTALGGDTDYMEKPSIIPWATTGGDSAYDVSSHGIIIQPYIMDIAISLLYPTHTLDYQTKKNQIRSAFEKFSHRTAYTLTDIFISESSEINAQSKPLYHHLHTLCNLTYMQDPQDVLATLDIKYSLYIVHGHSNPSGTDVHSNNTGWFSAQVVDTIHSPIFGADGCYVNGWWSNVTDNNILDSSINAEWYGSKIFSSTRLHVMVLGLLSQQGFSYPVSFIEQAIPDLYEGKTVAESMIGDTYVDNTLLVGDPTFHYIT
jgi:hypothetical protein